MDKTRYTKREHVSKKGTNEHGLKLWCCGNHKKVIINLMKISQGHELVNKYFSFILEFGSTNQIRGDTVPFLAPATTGFM